MVALTVLLVEAAIVLAALVVVLVLYARNARTSVRARVLVNLTDGSAVDGLLWARRGRLLVLRDANLIEPGTNPVALDGEIVLDRDRIAWVQAKFGGR